MSEPKPPTTTTTKITEPTVAAIAGSVTKVLPPITPAKPASPEPAANTSIHKRGTLWPKLSSMAGWVREAWMIQPKRVRTKSRYNAPSVVTETPMVKARMAGKDQQVMAMLASWQSACAGLPQNHCSPLAAEWTAEKAAPCNHSGG